MRINAAELVQQAYGLVSLLTGHATSNVGLVGDAVCAFGLCAPQHQTTYMKLVHRANGITFPIDGSRKLLSVPVGQCTVSLSANMHSAQECVATTYMLLADVFAEFGVPEGRYLGPDGTLRLRQWNLSTEQKGQVEAWAQQHGVPTSSEAFED
jgi:hypothetical protein